MTNIRLVTLKPDDRMQNKTYKKGQKNEKKNMYGNVRGIAVAYYGRLRICERQHRQQK